MDDAARIYINNKFMMEAVKVYILAEKYDVQPLKLYALKNFQLSLSKGYAVELDTFLACVTLMYTETPDSDRRLKDAMMNWVSKQSLEIVEKIMKSSDFATACLEDPHVGLEFREMRTQMEVRSME